jgi:hypothetical protein
MKRKITSNLLLIFILLLPQISFASVKNRVKATPLASKECKLFKTNSVALYLLDTQINRTIHITTENVEINNAKIKAQINTTTNKLLVYGVQSGDEIAVYSADNYLLLQQTAKNTISSIALTNQVNGLYTVRVTNSNGAITLQKFIQINNN